MHCVAIAMPIKPRPTRCTGAGGLVARAKSPKCRPHNGAVGCEPVGEGPEVEGYLLSGLSGLSGQGAPQKVSGKTFALYIKWYIYTFIHPLSTPQWGGGKAGKARKGLNPSPMGYVRRSRENEENAQTLPRAG